MVFQLNKPDPVIRGHVSLAGSKSISNRALIIRGLSGMPFEISRLANARDTALLQELMSSQDDVLDAGAAGTTYRFMTAFLALQPGTQVLTGSARMKQRPIGALVEALRRLGAQIEYLEREGYPPLRIGEPSGLGKTRRLQIAADTSSQYISALLMIAPTLPDGLELELTGKIVSRSYIEMTLHLMAYFGVKAYWEDALIRIPHQPYQARPFRVEADWSAASYYYAMAAFAKEADLQLDGLFPDSVQGDAVLAEMMERFGVRTTYLESGIHLSKNGRPAEQVFEWDFLQCPDLAQTLAVVCAGLGVKGLFSGLDTLRIKETDRIAALQRELGKVRSFFPRLPRHFSQKTQKEYYMVDGKADLSGHPVFDTYEDHRMAMAFAPLALFGPVSIREPMVVDKSYPTFYEDLERLGFEVKRQGVTPV